MTTWIEYGGPMYHHDDAGGSGSEEEEPNKEGGGNKKKVQVPPGWENRGMNNPHTGWRRPVSFADLPEADDPPTGHLNDLALADPPITRSENGGEQR